MITLLDKWRLCSLEWAIDTLYATEVEAFTAAADAITLMAPGENDPTDMTIQKVELKRTHAISWNGSAWVMVSV